MPRAHVEKSPSQEETHRWQCPECGRVLLMATKHVGINVCPDCSKRWNGYQWTAVVLGVLTSIGGTIGRDSVKSSTAGLGVVILFCTGSIVKAIRQGALKGGGFLS